MTLIESRIFKLQQTSTKTNMPGRLEGKVAIITGAGKYISHFPLLSILDTVVPSVEFPSTC